MHYLWGYSLSCKWIPQPDEQLQSLQSDCWTVRERVKPDSAANPERQKKKERWTQYVSDEKRRWYRDSCEVYLCDVGSTCITNTIEGQVERQEVLVRGVFCWERGPDQTSALVSYPVISQGQVSEPWPKRHTQWDQTCLCFWTRSVWLCELCDSRAAFREKMVVTVLWKRVALQCHNSDKDHRAGDGSVTLFAQLIRFILRCALPLQI